MQYNPTLVAKAIVRQLEDISKHHKCELNVWLVDALVARISFFRRGPYGRLCLHLPSNVGHITIQYIINANSEVYGEGDLRSPSRDDTFINDSFALHLPATNYIKSLEKNKEYDPEPEGSHIIVLSYRKCGTNSTTYEAAFSLSTKYTQFKAHSLKRIVLMNSGWHKRAVELPGCSAKNSSEKI